MPSLTGITVSTPAVDRGDQRNEEPNLDVGSKGEEMESEGLCHRSSRGYMGLLMSKPSGMKTENRTGSQSTMLPAVPECFPINENNSLRSLDNIGERGQKGKMIFLRLH